MRKAFGTSFPKLLLDYAEMLTKDVDRGMKKSDHG